MSCLAELGLVEEAQQTVEKWMARWIEIVSMTLTMRPRWPAGSLFLPSAPARLFHAL